MTVASHQKTLPGKKYVNFTAQIAHVNKEYHSIINLSKDVGLSYSRISVHTEPFWKKKKFMVSFLIISSNFMAWNSHLVTISHNHHYIST